LTGQRDLPSNTTYVECALGSCVDTCTYCYISMVCLLHFC